MGMDRQLKTNVIAVYNVPFVIFYIAAILAVAGLSGVVAFTGEPVGAYLARKPAMTPFVLLIVGAVLIECARCAIISYNIFFNGGRALFVQGKNIVFISKYFTSINMEQIVRIVPRSKSLLYIILSNGKSKKIYTSFLRPGNENILAEKLEALIGGLESS